MYIGTKYVLNIPAFNCKSILVKRPKKREGYLTKNGDAEQTPVENGFSSKPVFETMNIL